MISCTRKVHLADTQVTTFRIDGESAPEDPDLEEMIEPYREALADEMGHVIGTCSKTLTKQRPESTMGNWIADLLLDRSRAVSGQPVDAAFQNFGGLRVSALTRGPITIGEIYELMPFENLIVIVEVNGEIFKMFLDHIAAANGWPVSKTVRFGIRDGKAENILIDGKPLDPEKKYLLALPDYIANGGDRCTFFRDQKHIETGYLVRDAIIDDVKIKQENGAQISAVLDGRIVKSE